MNEKIQDILMEILSCCVNGDSGDRSLNEKLTPEMVKEVYLLAKKHSLAHLVSDHVFRNGIELPAEDALKFQQEDILRVYKHERMKFAFAQICQALDGAGIAYIPLKGSVLRDFYPAEGMRTSCDIDILVQEPDLEQAVESLEACGFRRGERHFHDISLFSPNGTHLELHFNILENMEQLDGVLKDAWRYAVPVEGSRYGFCEEFFVFHMYAHMAYHFMNGGCGVRSLLDIWVMEHRMGVAYTCAEKLLKEAEIWRFAVEMSKIANQCFADHNGSDPVMAYIWRGGVYGSRKNRITVQKKQEGSARAYLWKRLLPSRRYMIVGYPVLKKYPFLLPLCWVHRWFRAAFGGRNTRYITESASAFRISREAVDEIAEICIRLGL